MSVRVEGGQVMALLGENGAGKSTLVKILTGVVRTDEGEIKLDGNALDLRRPADAHDAGIVAIHQEPILFGDLSVAENVFINQPATYGSTILIDWDRMRADAPPLLDHLNFDIDVDARVGDLSLPQQHLVSVAGALSHEARVLIFDEPTAALSSREIEDLFAIIAAQRAAGKAIVFHLAHNE